MEDNFLPKSIVTRLFLFKQKKNSVFEFCRENFIRMYVCPLTYWLLVSLSVGLHKRDPPFKKTIQVFFVSQS